VLVRPWMPMARWHWLNLAMAVAAQDAIRMLGGSFNGGAEGGTRGIGRLTNTQSHEFEAPGMVAAAGLDVAVKWPNDLIVPSMGDRKLAGILAEMVLPANGEGAVVVGIGLNVRRPLDVDSEVAARGVWLNELLSAHMKNLDSGAGTELDTPRSSVDISLSEVQASSPSVDDVMNVLLSEFERQVAEVEDRPDAFLETYRQRCITVGRHVRAMLPSSDIVGTATGIDSDGQLLVTTADGTTHTISAADVVHIRPVSQS
jgi:BirA family transcriptional regulator, biotin operon repressor / biotin---[acetyl-CoA-carboxylase] ligase